MTNIYYKSEKKIDEKKNTCVYEETKSDLANEWEETIVEKYVC